MDSLGESVLVNKKCAAAAECLHDNVGCLLIDGQTMCISCCDEPYCNVSAPTNFSTAILVSNRPHSDPVGHNPGHHGGQPGSHSMTPPRTVLDPILALLCLALALYLLLSRCR
ncbi:unnamed protein product [Darwinula stevensoni]|uniref:Uncharacterized protein n=1 Tax=Darwinula stevensoni TaxID=69355 RepID=A0A7R9AFA4_9CRUS|nr:unnamed protein product [Darwinula stevensoni]CAG0903093.1 unnamed protein product [Darwinula stevensoni]